jgi:hypothetical protein
MKNHVYAPGTVNQGMTRRQSTEDDMTRRQSTEDDTTRTRGDANGK